MKILTAVTTRDVNGIKWNPYVNELEPCLNDYDVPLPLHSWDDPAHTFDDYFNGTLDAYNLSPADAYRGEKDELYTITRYGMSTQPEGEACDQFDYIIEDDDGITWHADPYNDEIHTAEVWRSQRAACLYETPLSNAIPGIKHAVHCVGDYTFMLDASDDFTVVLVDEWQTTWEELSQNEGEGSAAWWLENVHFNGYDTLKEPRYFAPDEKITVYNVISGTWAEDNQWRSTIYIPESWR